MISGYYNQIKNELLNNELYKRVKDYSKNRHELSTYYNVGKLLIEAGKEYGTSNLKRMRRFHYLVEKDVAVSHQSFGWDNFIN